ncbi:MAG: beta-lactamase family protein [Cyclobacteriaceae bacterium]
MNILKAILIIGLISLESCGSETERTIYFPSEKQFELRLDPILSKSDLPGLVAIASNKNGETVEYTYGNAIWNEDSPIKSSNIFRIASMTKLVTSVAALQLVENDSIKLDEDLSTFIPQMSLIPILTNEKQLVQGKSKITLRQLLTHTSGFGYFSTDSLLATHDRTDWNYDDLPRRFESGTQFLYGTSTDWVGKLVEQVSGLSLEEYFKINITGPLGMDRTWFNVPDSLKNEIVSYGRRGVDGKGNLTEIPNRIPENKTQDFSGGGGLFSSPRDYLKLLSCLLNDGIAAEKRILNKETVDMMFDKQIEGLSMNIEDNYFHPGLCCDFRGLIKPSSNWSLAGLIDTERTSYGRQKGTLLWGGIFNTYWYIDRESGIAASIYTQHLPYNHSATISVFDKFSEMIYENYN